MSICYEKKNVNKNESGEKINNYLLLWNQINQNNWNMIRVTIFSVVYSFTGKIWPKNHGKVSIGYG